MRPCGSWRATCRSRSWRPRRGPRCSTGSCRTSGTCAAPGSTAPTGPRVVDFEDSNLHVLNYSAPIDATVSLDELREHVFTHPTSDPDLVPYRTSYYVERWGFCMSRRQLRRARRPATIGSSSTRRSSPARHLRRGRVPGRDRRRGPRSRPTRATRRWPTTTSRASRCWRSSAARSPAAGAPLHLPASLGARDDRVDLLARAEPRRSRARPPRPRRLERRRPRPVHVQAQPSRERRDRSRRRPRPAVRSRRAACSIGRPTAATSGSSARRDSICRSARSRGRPPISSPSTTRRPTISTSSGRSTSAAALTRCSTSSMSSSRTARTRTSAPTASPNSGDAASTAGSAEARARRWRSCGC